MESLALQVVRFYRSVNVILQQQRQRIPSSGKTTLFSLGLDSVKFLSFPGIPLRRIFFGGHRIQDNRSKTSKLLFVKRSVFKYVVVGIGTICTSLARNVRKAEFLSVAIT